MKVKNSKDLKPPRFLLWGAPGVGKTVQACSASAHFDPEKLGKERQLLEDTFLIAVEDGIASLEGLQIEVPDVLDLTEDLVSDDGKASLPKLERALKEAWKYIHENANENSVVIFDSLTAMDTFANSFFEKHFTAPYEAYKKNIAFHLDQSIALSQLPGTLVVIAHGKVSAPIDNDDTRAHKSAKARASGLSEVHKPAQLALTGAADQHYLRQIGEIYFMERKTKRIKGESVSNRYFYPKGNDIGGGKTRYGEVLNAEEPANLRAIMRKIGVVK